MKQRERTNERSTREKQNNFACRKSECTTETENNDSYGSICTLYHRIFRIQQHKMQRLIKKFSRWWCFVFFKYHLFFIIIFH